MTSMCQPPPSPTGASEIPFNFESGSLVIWAGLTLNTDGRIDLTFPIFLPLTPGITAVRHHAPTEGRLHACWAALAQPSHTPSRGGHTRDQNPGPLAFRVRSLSLSPSPSSERVCPLHCGKVIVEEGKYLLLIWHWTFQ